MTQGDGYERHCSAAFFGFLGVRHSTAFHGVKGVRYVWGIVERHVDTFTFDLVLAHVHRSYYAS